MRSPHNEQRLPYAVVAGVDVNGMGVVRSLAKEKVPIIALDTELRKSTLSTRFGSKIQVPALSGKSFVDSLVRIAGQLSQKPVLILTQEDSVATVATAREQLARLYFFSMPSQSTMQMLMDKASFQQAAENLKSPIPRSIRLASDTAIAALGSLRFPCVIKPLVKTAEYSSNFVKAYKVSSAREAAELWKEMRKVVSEVIMQEWIEGEDSDVYFCLQYRGRSGTVPVSFVGRKICQWPPLIGGTASCIPAPDASDELVALTDAFFDAVGFVGLGSMEYKRDSRSQTFFMVEPTVGRTDYQEEIATLNGVNIPFAAYCGELGQKILPPKSIYPPRAWRDSIPYAKARLAGAPDSLNEISPNARIVDAYFRANDPMPYFVSKFEPISRRLKCLFGRT